MSDDARVEDAVPAQRAVVEGEPGQDAEQREDVVGVERERADLDGRYHDSGRFGSVGARPRIVRLYATLPAA